MRSDSIVDEVNQMRELVKEVAIGERVVREERVMSDVCCTVDWSDDDCSCFLVDAGVRTD